MRQHRKIGGHDRDRPPKKTKRGSGHPLPPNRQQRRHPANRRDGQGVDGVSLPVGLTPSLLLLTAHLFSPRLPKSTTFRRSQHVLNGHSIGAPSPRKPRWSSQSQLHSDIQQSIARSMTPSPRCTSRGWFLLFRSSCE